MKILLVQHNRLENMLFPLGLGYVAAVLRKEKHRVAYLDLAFEKDALEALKSKIDEFRPEVIGVTLITPGYAEFVSIFGSLKQERPITIVAGGVHAAIETASVLDDGIVDIAVHAEGELVAPALFRALANGADLAAVNGIAYRNAAGAMVKTRRPEHYADLDLIPSPPLDLFPVHRYTKPLHGMPATIIMTSRGCPNNCTFCYRGPASGQKVRAMSLDRVMHEIAVLHDNVGIRAFFFWDEVFTLDGERIRELCARIIDSGMKIYWACQTRVDLIDFQLARMMKKAGCVNIQFGVESGHPDILKKFNKGVGLEHIVRAFEICRKLRLPTSAFFILGTPWDTRANIRTTIEFAKKLRSTNTDFFAAIPYPGTLLKAIFEKARMPIPVNAEDYWYLRDAQRKADGASGAFHQHLAAVRQRCRRAKREVTIAMIMRIRDYPRVLNEMVLLYGFGGSLVKIARGLRGLLLK
jgi:radical SAM superfamily enzyme YgiQ (UPF0313 family)